ncbi:Armadillo repeat-containing protein 2 [Geodia barretti]|uniref:Armadillo repeat-containing protein 2 n=1 Tax=Geodia barretti TaxID=519541 RepID=A0AA35S168_GEOBA|nr:Armadillo repeat-containing protein 2 [Geodia barretti]
MLFGKNRTSSRPPSVYSIGARHFSESRPSTAQRLEPLDPRSVQLTEVQGIKPTPPTPVQSSSDLLPHTLSLTDVTSQLQHSTETLPRATAIENGISGHKEERRQMESHERERRSSAPLQSTVIPHPPQSSPVETTRRSGGARKKKKSESCPPFWESEISPLLSRLSLGYQLDPAQLEETVDTLHRRLRERECCCSSPSLLVKLAKIIISMEVAGKNLLNVCKLLFSLARTETNDALFSNEDISGPLLGLLRQCDEVSDSEALVYGVGTVKLLASNADLRPQLVENGALSFLHSLLSSYLQQGEVDVAPSTNIENVLVQLTAALRNLLEHSSLSSSLVSSGLLPLLARLLSVHLSHPSITFNISRLLSKLTLRRDCCEAVVSCPSFLPLLLHALTLHHSHHEILVRVCFILGNLTTDDDGVRYELCLTHKALSPLSSLLSSSLASELERDRDGTAVHEKSPDEEILIKLVRLLANLSVEARAGAEVASDKTIVGGLLTVLESLPLTSYSELSVNTLATLNNLSFHAPTDSYLLNHLFRLSQCKE